MKYEVRVGERCFVVHCEGRGAETRVSLDGEDGTVHWWTRARDGLYFLRLDGRTVPARMVQGRHAECHVDGGVVQVTVSDERELRIRALRGVSGGEEPVGEEVEAPMPGRVLAVPVEEGAEVAAGQAVAIVEAMKMENEVRALSGGTVSEICVSPGEIVELGQVLVRLG